LLAALEAFFQKNFIKSSFGNSSHEEILSHISADLPVITPFIPLHSPHPVDAKSTKSLRKPTHSNIVRLKCLFGITPEIFPVASLFHLVSSIAFRSSGDNSPAIFLNISHIAGNLLHAKVRVSTNFQMTGSALFTNPIIPFFQVCVIWFHLCEIELLRLSIFFWLDQVASPEPSIILLITSAPHTLFPFSSVASFVIILSTLHATESPFANSFLNIPFASTVSRLSYSFLIHFRISAYGLAFHCASSHIFLTHFPLSSKSFLLSASLLTICHPVDLYSEFNAHVMYFCAIGASAFSFMKCCVAVAAIAGQYIFVIAA
jgi:hypothetical protein